ncbi:alpha/beta hydrolase fold protein [Coriobacterium glomerans PW2]|uniref:Alpha/beta hydrolase fold protein n=1 Tax=Coriobacterium glomerans (strain ATCC 49209 / DSM 20642 / JCM 10262 / PW2) TaxID=700015 RepID=F2NBU1_CORGP|nr:alpha/beta hydrolase [Coriobacterium glomerans]AEB06900.1 alpha/beta hydrolase fold protein [Coriobacterium glomerans PW2]
MRTTELSYPSADGASSVHALIWEPDEDAALSRRGVIQIVHGMSEHIGRYIEFAEFLTAEGFSVCAHDQVGHGETASREADLGHIPLRRGKDILIADVHSLRTRAAEVLGADAPYIIFGHSMGSFVTRVYAAEHGTGVAAAIICGTGQQSPILTVAGTAITHVIAAIEGERHRSRLVDALGVGSYAKAIKGATTELDWLSRDPNVVSAYIADPACGQMFTVGGYATVAALVASSQRVALTERIPRDLPMLFIAGAEDPVGACGRGVHRAVEQYRRAGIKRVDEIIYPHARHEILNETIGTDVRRDIVSWLSERGI